MFSETVNTFTSLAGLGALVGVLVNLGKTLGWVKDGQAQKAAALGNLLAFLLVFALQFLDLPLQPAALDESANLLAQVFGLLLQMAGSTAAHALLRGLPWVGASYSLRAEE